MFSLIKFFFAFALSFLILSLPTGKGPLFDIAYHQTLPIMKRAIGALEREFKLDLSSLELRERYWNNSHPKTPLQKDEISTKNSSTDRNQQILHGDYTNEEREMLKKILINPSN